MNHSPIWAYHEVHWLDKGQNPGDSKRRILHAIEVGSDPFEICNCPLEIDTR